MIAIFFIIYYIKRKESNLGKISKRHRCKNCHSHRSFRHGYQHTRYLKRRPSKITRKLHTSLATNWAMLSGWTRRMCVYSSTINKNDEDVRRFFICTIQSCIRQEILKNVSLIGVPTSTENKTKCTQCCCCSFCKFICQDCMLIKKNSRQNSYSFSYLYERQPVQRKEILNSINFSES